MPSLRGGSSPRHPTKLSLELGRLHTVLEHLDSVDEDNRDVITVSLTERRVFVDVHLFQYELAVTTGTRYRSLGLVAKMATGARVDDNRSFLHHIHPLDYLLIRCVCKLLNYC